MNLLGHISAPRRYPVSAKIGLLEDARHVDADISGVRLWGRGRAGNVTTTNPRKNRAHKNNNPHNAPPITQTLLRGAYSHRATYRQPRSSCYYSANGEG